MPSEAVDRVLTRLTGVKTAGDGWQARCPAHEDAVASLHIAEGADGRALAHCHAGCATSSVLAAMGLTLIDLFPTSHGNGHGQPTATFDYTAPDGTLLYQVCRFAGKEFRQRRPDGAGGWIWKVPNTIRRVPYRVLDLQHALASGADHVFVVEGEKDADRLWSLELPATTNAGGAGKWGAEAKVLKTLGVTRVVILPDHDGPGQTHAELVASKAKALGLAVSIILLPGLPNHGDVSDWLNNGHTKAELVALVESTPYVIGTAQVAALSPAGHPPADDGLTAGDHIERRTDVALAERFAAACGQEFRYDHLRKSWLHYAPPRWARDSDKAVYRRAVTFVRAQQQAAVFLTDLSARKAELDFTLGAESKPKLEKLIDCATWVPPFHDKGEDWDADPWLLGTANGIIDLRTGVLRAGTPDDRLTMICRPEFDASASCPRWVQFLREVFDDASDVIAFIQRAVGYSLTADMREQCFFLCVGSGSNGKSTYLSTLHHVFGDYAYTTDMRTFASGGHADDSVAVNMAELVARRIVLASETRANSRLNEHVLKNFTGGEMVNAARKYGHPFEFRPVGKIWAAVNHQPKVVDDSFGFWRRVRIVPFERCFSGSQLDPTLVAQLQAEASGILTWAVEGCLLWQQQGLNPPGRVVAATDAYQQAEDPLTDFLSERTDPYPDGDISAAKFYAAYREWATDQGLSERERMTSTAFGRLVSRRFESHRTDKGRRYKGLRLRMKDLYD